MINFRFHVVSLVAVFLAFGLGILLGASFIDQGVVSSLETRQDRQEGQIRDLRREVLDLERTNSRLDRFIASGEPFLIEGALAERPVVILSFDSTDNNTVEQVAASLVRAGARIDGSIKLSNKLDLSSDERRRQAAILVSDPSAPAATISKEIVDNLTASLSGRAPGFLSRLVEGQLATVAGVEGIETKDPAALAQAGSAIVIVGAGTEGAEVDEIVSAPLARSLAGASVVTAVVEPGKETQALLGALRREDLQLVTVDAVDTAAGRASLAIGLNAAFRGAFGDYGLGRGATFTLPETQTSGQ